METKSDSTISKMSGNYMDLYSRSETSISDSSTKNIDFADEYSSDEHTQYSIIDAGEEYAREDLIPATEVDGKNVALLIEEEVEQKISEFMENVAEIFKENPDNPEIANLYTASKNLMDGTDHEYKAELEKIDIAYSKKIAIAKKHMEYIKNMINSNYDADRYMILSQDETEGRDPLKKHIKKQLEIQPNK